MCVTGVLTFLILPATQWRSTAHGILASALYVENWDLIRKSANYLNAFFPPTPLQHYWSLSVEGQFYLLWPLLLVLLDRLVFKGRYGGKTPAALFAGITLVLFAISVVVCYRASVPAYFSTVTRVWELALGGTIVFLDRIWTIRDSRLSAALGWIGMAAIVTASLTFSSSILFPGYAALLPTLGAALIIWSGRDSGPRAVSGFLSLPPLRYIGDISYSMYLWHWPIVIFVAASWGPGLSPLGGIAVFGLTVLLSHFSWTWVEKSFQKPRKEIGRRDTGALKLATLCTGMSAAFALGLLGYLSMLQSAASKVVFDPVRYPGALALGREIAPQPFVPSVLNARYDHAASQQDGCIAAYATVQLTNCHYGAADAKFRIVIVGDSHAEQWLPALMVIAQQRGASVQLYAKAHCAFADARQFLFEEGRAYGECDQWNRELLRKLGEAPPDMLITSGINGYQIVGPNGISDDSARMADGYSALWKQLVGRGIKIFAIKDTPFMPFDVPDCLARRGATVAGCSSPRGAVLKPVDPLAAAAGAAGATFIDMNDAICAPETCQSVVGNVLVYQDSNHLTATYARTLASLLEQQLK